MTKQLDFSDKSLPDVINAMAEARRHARDNAPHGSNDQLEAAMFLAMAAVVEKMYQIQADARELEDDDPSTSAQEEPAVVENHPSTSAQDPAEESTDEPAYTYSEPEPEPEPEEPDESGSKRKRKHR